MSIYGVRKFIEDMINHGTLGTTFYPRDAMLARVFATATCPFVCPSHAGIVTSRAKAGS